MNGINQQYGGRLRFIAWRYHYLKTLAKRKRLNRAERESLNLMSNLVKEMRLSLRNIAQPSDITIIYPDPNYTENYIKLYKPPFIFDGTKEAVKDYLQEYCATEYKPAAFDCTGQHFTTGFAVAHIRGNLWKVAEYMSVDV